MKKLIISISAGIVTALILIQIYTWFLHPEIQFYSEANAVTRAWEQQIRKDGEPCFVLAGGSETHAGLSPLWMQQENGIRVINTATAAPLGLETNIAIALNHIRQGDTLVLSLLLADDDCIPAREGGIKLAVQLFGTKAFTRGGIPATPQNIYAIFSSDARSMLVASVQLLMRGYTFIYKKKATIHPDGWMEIHRRGMENARLSGQIPHDAILSPSCTAKLKQTLALCRQAGARIIVMLPVGFSTEYESTRRLMHALQVTRLGIPVLRDERLGNVPDTSHLADSHLHLNRTGAEINSRIIASLLKQEQFWTEQELLERLQTQSEQVTRLRR